MQADLRGVRVEVRAQLRTEVRAQVRAEVRVEGRAEVIVSYGFSNGVVMVAVMVGYGDTMLMRGHQRHVTLCYVILR
jgi:hypothetical protein